MAPPQNGRCDCPGGPRRGSPYQAQDRARRHRDSPRRRTMATWTVLASPSLDGVAEPFRGRTARELDAAADGAGLQPPLGSQTCRGCGALFEHRGHLRSANHVARMAAAPLRDADAVARIVARISVNRRFAAAVLKTAPRCAPPPPRPPPRAPSPNQRPALSPLIVLPRTRRRKPSR
ncbi:unnamed protein product, partial [Ixodes pacificus]